MFRIYSQRDPRWASRTLGATTQTVGRFGCTTAAICSLGTYFGDSAFPSDLAADAALYDPNGLVIWANLRRHFGKMKFDKRVVGRNDAEIVAAMRDPARAVMLEVANGSHWVVGIRPTLIGRDYVCGDPWDATRKDLLRTYRNITKMAFFRAA